MIRKFDDVWGFNYDGEECSGSASVVFNSNGVSVSFGSFTTAGVEQYGIKVYGSEGLEKRLRPFVDRKDEKRLQHEIISCFLECAAKCQKEFMVWLKTMHASAFNAGREEQALRIRQSLMIEDDSEES